MMVRLPPDRIAQIHRSGSLRFRPNDGGIAVPLLCPDGSDGKLGSRLAYARAGAAHRICGRTCQYGRIAGPRRLSMAALWQNGIIWNRCEPELLRGSGRQWRESRCSDPWYRGRTGEQSALSPNGQIPSTIPRSTSDGVSKCSITLASDASGLRMAAAAPRSRLNIGCSPITSRNSAMAEHRSTPATVNASAVPITPARPCKPGQTDGVLTEGGRGFISLEIDRPATAPTLMRRLFLLGPEL
jgi:hypothetical protein